MRAVFGLVLIAGVALAGFAVYMVQGYFEQQRMIVLQQQQAIAQVVPTVDVIAVKRDMAYGEKITKDDIEVIKYAEPFLPAGVFRTEQEVFAKGDDALRVVLRPMEANEPILAIKVTEPGEDAGITSRLGKGMRAFAIKVDVTSGVSGFLRPGDKVDVYWSGQGGELSGTGITKLIQTNVRIVAVDQTADANQAGASIARTVTVEVTPQQVAALAQAQATGSLSLSLVGSEDDTVASATEVDQRTLLGIADTPAVISAPEAKVCTIKTRRGADMVEVPIPCATN